MNTEEHKRSAPTTYRLKKLNDFVYMFKDEISELIKEPSSRGVKSRHSLFVENVVKFFIDYHPKKGGSMDIWRVIKRRYMELPLDYKISNAPTIPMGKGAIKLNDVIMMRATKRRDDYSRMVFKYQSKRREIRSKYKVNDPYRIKQLKLFTDRIRIYRAAIKRIDKYNTYLNEVNMRIYMYFGYSMYKSSVNWRSKATFRGTKSPAKYMVRKMFIKTAKDNGIPSNIIGLFVGISTAKVPQYRRDIGRLISKDGDVKELWIKFKNIIHGEEKPIISKSASDNRLRWKHAPDIGDIIGVINKSNKTISEFEKSNSIPEGTISKIELGKKTLPAKYWQIFYENM